MNAPDSRTEVLIVGSSGAFGARIAELMSKDDAFDVILAGRTLATLKTQADTLSRLCGRPVRHAVLDAEGVTADALSSLGVRVIINASGPFQTGSYALARASIGAACHYVDLADARDFVVGIRDLDAEAGKAGVLVVSGASSVPGLSSAVVEHHRAAFSRVRTIDIAISPGNAFDPGIATVASVLGGVGQSFPMLRDGTWQTVHGWQGLRRGAFGAAGRRWLGYVDVPDLALLPTNVAGVETVRFQAGLEVSAFHLGLWASSWLVRLGVVKSLAPLAGPLLAMKRKLGWLGTDRGGMTVSLAGHGRDGVEKQITWTLVAREGHGPYVPALAAVALARRLALGTEMRRGAMACYGLVSLTDILAEARGLAIDTSSDEKTLPS